MHVHTRYVYAHVYILAKSTYLESKNVGGEHHDVLSSLVRRRANDWSTSPFTRPRAYALHGVKGLLYSRWACIPESKGLESHSTPLSSSLCLARSLKWPPSWRFLIGPKLPSFCALMTLPSPCFLSFFLSFHIWRIHVSAIYIHFLEKSSFVFAHKTKF